PCGRFNRNSLVYLLNLIYYPQHVRPAHRLDANTTGVVVLSRTAKVAAELQPQFSSGQVRKCYLALVQGHPDGNTFECDAGISPQPLSTGSRIVDSGGRAARTQFTVVERRCNGTSLVRANPLTGRTNQIRVHLWHLGFPIVGDPTYLPAGSLAANQTLGVGAPAMCLHAWLIQFRYPGSSDTVAFTAPPPIWALTGDHS
ncbi:MAG: RluA family pseudouridine synthase, partial [Planctomycetales bacterium]|nr:RluA family pseudouridine synthase [Planctomycetales bacterium]